MRGRRGPTYKGNESTGTLDDVVDLELFHFAGQLRNHIPGLEPHREASEHILADGLHTLQVMRQIRIRLLLYRAGVEGAVEVLSDERRQCGL
jgi:hypothetical protein